MHTQVAGGAGRHRVLEPGGVVSLLWPAAVVIANTQSPEGARPESCACTAGVSQGTAVHSSGGSLQQWRMCSMRWYLVSAGGISRSLHGGAEGRREDWPGRGERHGVAPPEHPRRALLHAAQEGWHRQKLLLPQDARCDAGRRLGGLPAAGARPPAAAGGCPQHTFLRSAPAGVAPLHAIA